MSDVWKELNLKDAARILVVHAPESFEQQVVTLDDVKAFRAWGKVRQIDFVLAFVTKLREVERHAKMLGKKTSGDATVWFAYPKQTSENFQCEFNRDNGCDAVQSAGFDGVRQVAIDDDLSTLRFRRREFIKSSR